jgi:hypothetical protein
MDGDYDDPGPQNTLSPSESLDSDDVRNDDGDVVVDAPNRWIAVVEHQSLAQRLAAEQPELSDAAYAELPRRSRRHYGQIDGTPEDGESFYAVHHDDADDDYDED